MRVVVLDRALGTVGVGGSKRRADVFEADAIVEDRARIDLDPDRRQRGAGNVDLANARKLRQPLLKDVGGDVIELAGGVGRRGHGDDHDRGIRGVDLVVGRILPQAGWQIHARGNDTRLNISGRPVDIAIEAELQSDARGALGALRRHFIDVGDLAEMPFERRGD